MSDFKLNFNGRVSNPDDRTRHMEIKADADGLLENHLVHGSSDKQEGPGGGIIIRTVLIPKFQQTRGSEHELKFRKKKGREGKVERREVG